MQPGGSVRTLRSREPRGEAAPAIFGDFWGSSGISVLNPVVEFQLLQIDVILSAAIAGRGTLRLLDTVDALDWNACAASSQATSAQPVRGFRKIPPEHWHARAVMT
jgi:hypothetical protein